MLRETLWVILMRSERHEGPRAFRRKSHMRGVQRARGARGPVQAHIAFQDHSPRTQDLGQGSPLLPLSPPFKPCSLCLPTRTAAPSEARPDSQLSFPELARTRVVAASLAEGKEGTTCAWRQQASILLGEPSPLLPLPVGRVHPQSNEDAFRGMTSVTCGP